VVIRCTYDRTRSLPEKRRWQEMSESGIEDLIDFWKHFDATGRKPCVHPEDLDAMTNPKTKRTDPDMSSVSKFFELTSPEQADYFHLSLSPVPYMGNLRSADIFLLMLNPKAGYEDYYTNADPAFRQALTRTLKQDFEEGEKACLALNPQHCGSSWFCYYEELLRPTLWDYAKMEGLNYWQALGEFSCRVAILELVPYYSTSSAQINGQFLRKLTSAQKAKTAAQDLRKRAQDEIATVIVRWSAGEWGLRDADKIIQHKNRGGKLNSEEKGAILKRLQSQHKS
jgi:hypothetical protein